MFVKICGTTNLLDAELAVELGADALGFLFAPSKRRVTVEQVAAMTRHLPSHVGRVGVFTAPDAAEIGRTVREAGLSAVQMHWPYDSAVVAAVRDAVGEGIGLWQVVGFEVRSDEETAADRTSARALRDALLDRRLAVVLLDAVRDGASGGLGMTFAWSRAETVLRSAHQGAEPGEEPRLAIAGGLHAGNVEAAILTFRPWGVDVVSGVEAAPGKKSAERMEAFFAAVRAAEARQPPL